MIATLLLLGIIESIAISLIIFAISSAITMALAPGEGQDRRTDGRGQRLRGNVADPAAPMPRVYGRPRFKPYKLSEWTEGAKINDTRANSPSRRFELYHCGWGPVDGSRLAAWLDSTKLLDSSTVENPSQLTRIDAYRYRLPEPNVVESSITVFRNGTPFSLSAGKGNAYNFEDSLEQQVDKTMIGVKIVSDDPNAIQPNISGNFGALAHSDPTLASGEGRYGMFFPIDGILPSLAHVSWMEVQAGPDGGVFEFRSGRKVTTTKYSTFYVDSDDLGRGVVSGGKQYIYLDLVDHAKKPKIQKVRCTYRIKPQIFLVRDGANGDIVQFQTPNDASDVFTATYLTSQYGEAVQIELWNGDNQQTPVTTPYGGVPRTSLVDAELDEEVSRTYVTSEEVDDVHIVLESGPSGFYDFISEDNDFVEERRTVSLYVREDGAPNASTDYDPAKGWVTLRVSHDANGNPGSPDFVLTGNVRGTATWTFSVAELLRFSRPFSLTRGDENGFINIAAKRRKYEVKVVATDAADTLTTVNNDLWFKSVTEIVREQFVLPRSVLLLVTYDDTDEEIDSKALWVQFNGAMVLDITDPQQRIPGVPTSGFVYPRRFSRNPILCACDLWTQRLFGGGEYYTFDDIDLDSAVAAANFCDANETFLDGSIGPRSELDWVLDQRVSLIDAIQTMCAGSRVWPYFDGSKLRFAIDQDGDSVMSITEDMIPATAELRQLNVESKPNVLVVDYRPEPFFDDEPLPITSSNAEPLRRVERQAEMPGVRRQAQAELVGKILLRQFERHDEEIQFSCVGLDPMRLEPGDIVDVTYPKYDVTGTWRVTSVGFGDNLITQLKLVRHDSWVYTGKYEGPNSGAPPGRRPPRGPGFGDSVLTRRPSLPSSNTGGSDEGSSAAVETVQPQPPGVLTIINVSGR